MNKQNIHTNIIGISSFRNSLKHRFSSTSFYFKSKIVEVRQKVKIKRFLTLGFLVTFLEFLFQFQYS